MKKTKILLVVTGREAVIMTTRDMALNIVDRMTEEQLQGFVSLFRGIVSDVPSDETLAAMKEAEEMLMDPQTQQFSSVEDLFAELRA